MLALVWGAIRSRRAQALTVLLLTALATAVAAAGPWFAAAGSSRAAAGDVASAPAGERTLSIRKIAQTAGDPSGALDQFVANVRGLIPLPAGDPVAGLVQPLIILRGELTPSMEVAYREDVCAHLRLDGTCPVRPGEVAISVNTSRQLDLGPGDRLDLRTAPDAKPLALRVVATYALTDPAGSYWSDPLFTANGGLDPAFTPLETFRAAELSSPTVSYDVQVSDRLIRGDGGYDLAAVLRRAGHDLAQDSLRLVDNTGPLLRSVAEDRAAIRRGVLVAVLQVVVLAWFAIGLAGHYTGRDRRGDAALVKLRGGTRGALLRLAWGQHVPPLVLGALAGLPLGYALARLLAGPVDGPATLRLSAVAAGAVLAGGLVVLALIEAVALRRPVADLLREVTGRGDWRSGLADVLLLAVAVAGIYQARSGAAGAGLALAAPALVALAVALLVARLLGRVADRGGGAAVRAGRLRLGLTAVQVSRQPGSDRVFALVVVAVAVFTTGVGGYLGERTARLERGAAELGATRVLGVQAPNRTVLLAAVRAADPAGDQAMAVAVDTTTDPPVLAVDSGRLAAVARWRPEYGPLGALAAGAGPAALPRITGHRLAVRVAATGPAAATDSAPASGGSAPASGGSAPASGGSAPATLGSAPASGGSAPASGGSAPATLTLVLQHEGTGAPVTVDFGRVGPGERTLSAPVAGCAEPPGCRILHWEVAGRPGASISLRGLDQLDPPGSILDAARLGDIARWRAGTAAPALSLAATGGALTLTVPAPAAVAPEGAAAVAPEGAAGVAPEGAAAGGPEGVAAYAVDTDLPLPVVLAGPAPEHWQFGEATLLAFGREPTPVRVAATATALPVLGRRGVLADLDATRRVIGDASPPGQFQVWLAPGARPGIVAALTRAGLTVGSDVTIAGRARDLDEQAPAVVTRFALLAGVVVLLLAAAALGVAAAVDRRARLDQLRALRVQGLPRNVAVATAYAGMVGLVLSGLLAGLVAAALARPIARITVPAFADGWDVLPLPGALGPVSLALAALAAWLVLGLVGWLATRPLTREARR
ncbi:FtsX-like permease family protein [Actinoplanes subtropicus]|uniref:FtsX-like permease family protein n=1 Tax=Actinoplanes subtropicus TaxID=543632 RepID=UPI0005584AA3|nr:FtsX-like permease family protein [Actinoplanes subtropicus]